MLQSADLTCPYCWETISVDVDASAGACDYVEDCQVCCHPIRIRVELGPAGELEKISADRENP